MLEPMILNVFKPDVQAADLFVTRAFFTPRMVECFGCLRWRRGLADVCFVGLGGWFGSRCGFSLLQIGYLIADEP